MIIKVNGRRLTGADVDEILRFSGHEALAKFMAADGYHLQPLRAPRRYTGNIWRLNLTWTRRDPGEKHRATFRLEVKLDVAPA
jgi:hypothetical protein